MLGPVSFVAGACEIQALMREEDEHEIEEMHAKVSICEHQNCLRFATNASNLGQHPKTLTRGQPLHATSHMTDTFDWYVAIAFRYRGKERAGTPIPYNVHIHVPCRRV